MMQKFRVSTEVETIYLGAPDQPLCRTCADYLKEPCNTCPVRPVKSRTIEQGQDRTMTLQTDKDDHDEN